MHSPDQITFFNRFEEDILTGKKVITIRDENENNFEIGKVIDIATFEDGRVFGKLKVLNVTPLAFNEINDFHALQENMTLEELKGVLAEVYPGIESLYLILFEVER